MNFSILLLLMDLLDPSLRQC